ncbi:hypothetical protein NFI96_025449 [Prochilodus magdalenae]|nr:hypothetical protein NFI96_025449 [Prochilodus magdalenae]
MPSMSHPVGVDGRMPQDHMHTDHYNDCPQHHINVTKDCSGVVPDCHGVTLNGSESSSVTSPALVLVETPNEPVCGGTVVSTKMNGVLSHVQKAWCHSTSTPTAPSAGTVHPAVVPSLSHPVSASTIGRWLHHVKVTKDCRGIVPDRHGGSDSEWQRVIFSDESRFSIGGDGQRIRVEAPWSGTPVSSVKSKDMQAGELEMLQCPMPQAPPTPWL